MRTLITALLCFGILVCLSCQKSPTSSDYKDGLTLGTGMSGFTLTGEGTTFNLIVAPLQLYWRLETAADMAGSDVTIRIDNITHGTPILDTVETYLHLQDYGHIMVSSIPINSRGSYRATGTLVTGNRQIASVDFTVQ